MRLGTDAGKAPPDRSIPGKQLRRARPAPRVPGRAAGLLRRKSLRRHGARRLVLGSRGKLLSPESLSASLWAAFGAEAAASLFQCRWLGGRVPFATACSRGRRFSRAAERGPSVPFLGCRSLGAVPWVPFLGRLLRARLPVFKIPQRRLFKKPNVAEQRRPQQGRRRAAL
ncbi:hypothetical protein M885DRAFT_326686 [Pelagophyceae sp. CCMP2097]|nr:hypothetical protein M885DRAFT_326686 [Pelagophyceae sp. CCMP2097]